jgi:hypothetical protein
MGRERSSVRDVSIATPARSRNQLWISAAVKPSGMPSSAISIGDCDATALCTPPWVRVVTDQ